MLEETWERALKSAIKLWFRVRYAAEIPVCTLRLYTCGRREVMGPRRGLAWRMPKYLGSVDKRLARFSSRYRVPIAFLVFWIDPQKQTSPNQCLENFLLRGGSDERALGLRIRPAKGGRHR